MTIKGYRYSKSILILVCLLALSAQAALSSKPESALLAEPAAALEPGDVVRIVIEALADNDNPYKDAGIATTYNFASPSNRVNTGPLPRFRQMLKGGVYSVMIDHRNSEFSEVVRQGNTAYQYVRLITRQGNLAVFAFRLSLQGDGVFRDMWMTEAVWPLNQ